MEAHDSDAVVRAFVAHGQERHAWSYPEEAIRNYARNYAEAVGRLTGGTQRLSEIADITVHPVTEDRVGDWLRFFDHDAFAVCVAYGGHLNRSPLPATKRNVA